MYTLEGRIRFHLALRPEDEASFHNNKLREIVLSRTAMGGFELSFQFSAPAESDEIGAIQENDLGEIPEYVLVEEST
jgi:hypothetical protein